MAFTEVDYLNGGGGGNVICKDSSEITVPLSTNTTFQIDTGLSSISKFVMYGKATGFNMRTQVSYDSRNPNNFYMTSYAGAVKNNPFGTTDASGFGIQGISGGVVTLITPTSSTDYCTLEDGFVFAE